MSGPNELFVSFGDCHVAARDLKKPMKPVRVDSCADLVVLLDVYTAHFEFTRAHWHALDEAKRTKLKHGLGWLVGGLVDGPRLDANTKNRTLLTLDLETQWREVAADYDGKKKWVPKTHPMPKWRKFRRKVTDAAKALDIGLVAHISTGYTDEHPRYRVFVLLAVPIEGKKKLEQLTQWAAHKLGVGEWLGSESYTYSQPMFLPVDFVDDLLASAPGTSGLYLVDGPPLDPDFASQDIVATAEQQTVIYGDRANMGEDPIPVALEQAGLNPRPHPGAGIDPDKRGWVLFDCPHADHHAVQNDSQTCYMPATTGHGPGVKCFDTHADGEGGLPHMTFNKLVEYLVAEGALATRPIVLPPGDGQQPLAMLMERFFSGRMKYDHERREWLAYGAARGWKVCQYDEHRQMVTDEVIPWLQQQVIKFSEGSQLHDRAKGLLALARTAGQVDGAFKFLVPMPSIATTRRNFDTNPYVLGLRNGWLDLSTDDLTLQPYAPEVLVSKRAGTSWQPDAACQQWHAFLKVVVPDPELRAYLQRLAGYLLIGDVSLEKLFFLYGKGANGKSTFVETLQALLGDYCTTVRSSVLMRAPAERSAGSATPELIPLVGARLALAHETEAGARLSGKRVKELASTDTVTARANYGAEFTFKPTAKIVMVGNHKPIVTDTDDGLWRRFILVPFTETIPQADRDPELKRKLLQELPGILVWGVQGARQVLANLRGDPLAPPELSRKETQGYRDESDVLGQWLREQCERGGTLESSESDAYENYRVWIEQNGLNKPWSKNQFTRNLAEDYDITHNHKRRSTEPGKGQVRHYRGMRLLRRSF